MAEQHGNVIYQSSRPDGLDISMVILIILTLILLVTVSLAIEMGNLRFLAVFLAILMIPLEIFAIVMNDITIVFENGVSPSDGGFAHNKQSPRYFIPFIKIKLIGATNVNPEKVSTYYFLMTDGSVAKCGIASAKSEAQSVLARQLHDKCPGLETVRVKWNWSDDGASPRELPKIFKRIEEMKAAPQN